MLDEYPIVINSSYTSNNDIIENQAPTDTDKWLPMSAYFDLRVHKYPQ